MQVTGYTTVPLIRKDKNGMYILDDDVYWEVGELYQYKQDTSSGDGPSYERKIMAYVLDSDHMFSYSSADSPPIRYKFRDGEYVFMLLKRAQSPSEDFAHFLVNEVAITVPMMARYEGAFSKFVKRS